MEEARLPVGAGRVASVVRIWLAGTQASVLPTLAMGLLQSAVGLVHVGNALLTRYDDIQLRKALARYNEQVTALRKEAIKGEGKDNEGGSSLPQVVDIVQHMAQVSPFPQTAVAAGTAAKHARQGAQPTPDKLTVYEFACSLDEITATAVGQALWHYVVLPAASKALANAATCQKTAIGAALGTLVWPGMGTTIGSILASIGLF